MSKMQLESLDDNVYLVGLFSSLENLFECNISMKIRVILASDIEIMFSN